MQPAPDNLNKDNDNSRFDFLDNDDWKRAGVSSEENDPLESTLEIKRTRRGRKPSESQSAEKPFPIIRKPVSVKETGALRPPLPDDPIEPPPPLTYGARNNDGRTTRVNRAESNLRDIDSLDLDIDGDNWPGSEQWVDNRPRGSADFYDAAPSGKHRKLGYIAAFLLIGSGVVATFYTVPAFQQWVGSTVTSVSTQTTDLVGGYVDRFSSDLEQNPELVPVGVPESVPPEVIEQEVAIVEPLSLYDQFTEQLALLESLVDEGSLEEAEQVLLTMDRTVYGYGAPEFSEISERISAIQQGDVGTEQVASAPEPDSGAQQEQLGASALIEAEKTRLEAEALQTAEQLAAGRLAQEQRAAAEAQRVAEEQRAAAEAQRVAEEQRAADEVQRLAEEQRAADEVQRLAEEQRAAAEAQRVAEEQSAAAEAQRIAEEQRAAAEVQRLAEEQSAAAEAQRLAEAQSLDTDTQRLAELRAEQEQAAVQSQIRADRLAQEQARQEQLELARQERAFETQIIAPSGINAGEGQVFGTGLEVPTIQDIAARQREEARQQRLLEARQREEQIESAGINASEISISTATEISDTKVALAETDNAGGDVQRAPQQSISDADLQRVYGQFAQLKDAIEARDINAVLRLTVPSGIRIQQVMQMFENNSSISARLRNVSTLDAAGEIQGVLQITRLERLDGSVTGPSLDLGSVRLSAVRDGNGWSSIRW